MRLQLSRMAVILTLGVAGVVVGAFSIGAYINSSKLYDEVIDASRANAEAQAETIRIALEHQMLLKDRTVIDSMVRSFASDPLVNAVMILDWRGELKYTSQTEGPEPQLSIESETCQACHRKPAEERDRSTLIDTQQGEVLRIATPIRNRKQCHSCHSAKRRMNGLLLVDMKVGELKRRLDADVRRMVIISAILALVAMAGISLIIRIAFLRRLNRFEKVARAIASGDFDKRLPVRGDDTLAWFARQFNSLTDAVTKLLRDVQSERQQLERVINALDDGIVVLDRSMKIVAVNDALLAKVGKGREEVVGLTCHDVMGAVCGEDTPCSVRACFGDSARQTTIVRRRTDDGQIRHEEVQASPVLAGNGEVEFVVESWRDITHRRAAEARLAESHRLASLGMLASGFSHELNTPLGTTLTCVEGIARAAGEEEADLEYIEEGARIAQQQLMRCRAITQQFLLMARGEATGEDLINIRQTVLAMVRLVSPTAREKKVNIEAAEVPENVFVRASEADVQQVLLNLLLNAVQACDDGGRVEVGCVVDSVVSVTVTDNGCGMTEEVRRRILEPFFSRRPDGTGLGLFISRELVEKWGGELVIASLEGEGSVFTVTFQLDSPGGLEDAGEGEA